MFQYYPESPSNLDLHGMIEVQKVDWDNTTGKINFYIQNFGLAQEIKEIHVNGKLDEQAIIDPNGTLKNNQTCEVTLSETFAIMPSKITIGVYGSKSYMCETASLIEFQMLGLYWNENTQKIHALITDTGIYPQVNFGTVYVNRVEDNGAIIKEINNSKVQGKIFNISLSGTYPTKPSTMLLDFTADGVMFNLTSPFTTDMIIDSPSWDAKTGEVTVLVYSPYFNFAGEKATTFDGVYVNGVLDNTPILNRVYPETFEAVLSTRYPVAPANLTIRVVADSGAVGEEHFVWTSQGFYIESHA